MGINSLSPGRYFGRNSLCPGDFGKNTRHSYANIARNLPLTKSTKTELQRIDTPVPLPEPPCRCHLERTDDHHKLVRAHHEVSRDWVYPVTSHHELSRDWASKS
jgi:hypothetical protein